VQLQLWSSTVIRKMSLLHGHISNSSHFGTRWNNCRSYPTKQKS